MYAIFVTGQYIIDNNKANTDSINNNDNVNYYYYINNIDNQIMFKKKCFIFYRARYLHTWKLSNCSFIQLSIFDLTGYVLVSNCRCWKCKDIFFYFHANKYKMNFTNINPIETQRSAFTVLGRRYLLIIHAIHGL